MPNFSIASLKKLETTHPYLQLICNKLIKLYDVKIIYGHRTPKEQFELYKLGRQELYNAVTDHKQKRNLAKRYPDIAQSFNDQVIEFMSERIAIVEGVEITDDPNQLEKLKTLGYTE